MKMKNFTIIPNEILCSIQLSIPARYLLCVLLRYCGQDGCCYPSQTTLSDDLGYSERQVRNLLQELKDGGLIHATRRGFNKPNTYEVTKSFVLHTADRKSSSYHLGRHRKYNSSHLGSMFPLHQGNSMPTNITYRKAKDKKTNIVGMKKLKEILIKKDLW
jgi:biotin operon repressor